MNWLNRIVASISAGALSVSGFLPVAASATESSEMLFNARGNQVNALRLLKDLRTTPEKNRNYDRAKFADWIDKDGCDTRAEVLIAESLRHVRKGSGCYVRTGR